MLLNIGPETEADTAVTEAGPHVITKAGADEREGADPEADLAVVEAEDTGVAAAEDTVVPLPTRLKV